jgi:hypothetical protein
MTPNAKTASLICLSVALWAAALIAPAAGAPTAPSYAVVDRIAIPDGGFDFASFDPATGRVYLSRSDGALALDVGSGAVTGHLAAAQHSHAVIPVLNGAEILITDSASNSAHLADAQSGRLIADIPTGTKPDGAILEPATGLALVMNGASGDVTLIDPAAGKAVGQIAVAPGLESPAADGTGKVYVSVEATNRIAVLDVKARALVGYYPLAGCEGPTGMVYAGEAGVLIVACANGVAKVVRAADGQVVSTLPIGAGPDQAIYDPKRRLAFIPCGRDGAMQVIAVRGPTDVTVVQTVATQPGARGGAVDPGSGKIYLPTAQYGPPITPGGHPVAKPGTFVLLVVAPKS